MRLTSAIAFVLATVLGAMPGHAETWAALLISNGGYQNAPVLPNPTNDASDVAASLERLGLSVRRVTNGIFEHMRHARAILPCRPEDPKWPQCTSPGTAWRSPGKTG